MPTRASTSTLVSLAMLYERINNHGHYLDNFTPFILHIIRGTSIGDPVDEVAIQQDIKDKFGLFIPNHSITLLLGRLARLGILRKDHGKFLIQRAIEEDLRFEPTRADLERSMTDVVNAFIRFSKDEHKYELNSDRAYEIIFGFLSEFSIECLAASERNTPFPSEVSKLRRKEQVLIASFFKHLQKNHLERFRNFSVVVKGYMFTNSILCPSLTEEKFSKTTFYLDTPIIMNALGLNGDRRKIVANEMINLLRDKEGTLKIFDHTRDEVSSIILWVANNGSDPKEMNPAAVEMRKRKLSRADMMLRHDQFPQDLRSMGIRIEGAPSFERKNFSYQIDENELKEILRTNVRYRPRNPNAVTYDVKSVRAIRVLRQERTFSSLEKATAVFVTSNSSFAYASKQYELQDRPTRVYRVPSVVTDLDVTTIAWLKSSMTSEIPEQRLIATIYAKLMPEENFWIKALQTAERLRNDDRITEESLLRLRSDLPLMEMFTEKTLGDLNDSDMDDGIENFLNQLDSDRKAEIMELRERGTEQNAEIRELRERNTERKAEIMELRERDTEQNAEIMELRGEINEKNQHEEARNKHIETIAKKAAFGLLAGFIVLAISSWLITGTDIIGIIGVISGLFGITIPQIRDWISSRIANFLKRKFLRTE